MNLIYDPWPWYVAGPLIALTMFILLFAGKKFGMSSNLSTMCTIGGAGKFADYFKFDWKSDRWNLIVVLGAIIGGYIASRFMSGNTVLINPEVAQQLSEDYGITSAGQAYLPPELFATQQLTDPFVLVLLILGGFMVGFGIVLVKSEAVSWYRIFEMFKFQSFHMYGIIGSALVLGVIGIQLIKKFKIKAIGGAEMNLHPKKKGVTNYLLGGIIFGLGWALAGACPGPMYVLAGAGYYSILIVIGGALLGTFVYGVVKDKLPH